jgi:hypothetical protein
MESLDRGKPLAVAAPRKTGEQCREWAIKGALYDSVYAYGRCTPQTKAKARQRIEGAADPMAVLLIEVATDEWVGGS